jgi:hypothetical protein
MFVESRSADHADQFIFRYTLDRIPKLDVAGSIPVARSFFFIASP